VTDAFALDRKALAAIVFTGLVLGPGLILVAVGYLTHGLDPSATTPFEWFATALCLLVCFAILRGMVRELSSAIGLRFDDQGIARGRTRIAWSAITAIDSPEFGHLILCDDSGRKLRIATYLFRDRALLLREIGQRVRAEPRERTLSR
jgi:hypothetical protein